MAMAVSNQQSRDAALLRATTELFVLEGKHDGDEVRRFEELATHFLARVSPADRAFVAERLSRSVDAPASILRLLGRDLAEIASPILRRSSSLGEFDLLAIMAATGPVHHRLIATRQDLTPLVVAALRRTGDPEVLERVAAYPDVQMESAAIATPPPAKPEAEAMPPGGQPEVPADGEPDGTADYAAMSPEAREIYAAVQALATQLGTPPARPAAVTVEPPAPDAAPMPEPEASLAASPAAFLDLGRDERRAVMKTLESPATPRARASTAIEADRAFRLALGRARLAASSRRRRRDALIHTLASGLRLDEAVVTALVDDPSGEPLVVLLAGIGLTAEEAEQVLLFANPVIAAGVERLEGLASLMTETKQAAAAALIERWRRGGDRRQRSGHQPQIADIEPKRAVRPLAAQAGTAPARPVDAAQRPASKRGA